MPRQQQGLDEGLVALGMPQEAVAHESRRIAQLGQGGFASPNEIEQKAAESASGIETSIGSPSTMSQWQAFTSTHGSPAASVSRST